ncbi:MAG: (d)CMP kinase [Bacteroidota bacterium]|nr:(d)CMP kinase [Candidatus Kapabacteria bacterium]MDW8219608.1 (d)CMP kinase [Bacteroidota bacterium]
MDASSAVENQKIVIAIDGPSGSGKSTTARRVAKELGYLYIDTGAMYRAVALAVLREDRALTNYDVEPIVRDYRLELVITPEGQRTILGREDVTEELRSPKVTQLVSAVSALPVVREVLSKRQREMGRHGGVVMDGRDIGTAVFPDAELKIFLVASLEERARRRLAELGDTSLTLEQMCQQLYERDKYDSERLISPLRRAPDAVEIDTSEMSIEEQTERIVQLARERIAAKSRSVV